MSFTVKLGEAARRAMLLLELAFARAGLRDAFALTRFPLTFERFFFLVGIFVSPSQARDSMRRAPTENSQREWKVGTPPPLPASRQACSAALPREGEGASQETEGRHRSPAGNSTARRAQAYRCR